MPSTVTAPVTQDVARSMNNTDRKATTGPSCSWWGPVRIAGAYRARRVDWWVYRVEPDGRVPIYVFVKPKADQRTHANAHRSYVVRVATVGRHRGYTHLTPQDESPDPLDGFAWRNKPASHPELLPADRDDDPAPYAGVKRPSPVIGDAYARWAASAEAKPVIRRVRTLPLNALYDAFVAGYVACQAQSTTQPEGTNAETDTSR